ncbi:hypothetical protein GIB67_034854 [Kingdonia uniflora]|uniref:Potassium channel domain-containing protein n=1 Tax=Kingdonia uniflora TaxID=39325 RepID=A0A7J7ME97_9MAGN|nr:hypothetical protein GIB67_034854 [Kingdonia uniflora]
MEREPLLIPYTKRRKPLQQQHLSSTPPPLNLCSLPEDQEVSLPSPSPLPMTPSELKDRLIFGPPSPDSSTISIPINHDVDDDDALIPTTPGTLEDDIPTIPSSSSSWLTDPTLSLLPWSKKTNLHRSRTAPAMAVINDFDLLHPHISKPKFTGSSSSIVRQAFLLLLLYLSLGVVIYSFNRKNFSATETHPVVDALYFCIVTMCTIGYGDITPTTTTTKLFSILFVLVGFGFIDILLSGMVSYVLDLQESLLLSAVKGGAGEHNSYFFDLKKGRMRIRMKVGLALGVVVLCIGVGTGVMHFIEHLDWLDSFYLSVMSVTTVGYGDRAFKSLSGRVFASIWLLVSTLAVARAFLYLAEARIDKRHRMMAKWVLRQDMTVSEFLAADIDNNGFVRFVGCSLK